MEEINDQKEIWEAHKEWAENHFHANIAKITPNK